MAFGSVQTNTKIHEYEITYKIRIKNGLYLVYIFGYLSKHNNIMLEMLYKVGLLKTILD